MIKHSLYTFFGIGDGASNWIADELIPEKQYKDYRVHRKTHYKLTD